MRWLGILFASTALVLTPVEGHSQVPVIDDDVLEKRSDDETHGEESVALKTDEVEQRTVTSCNISKRERGRRLTRSPAKAVAEEPENVALIKYYAQKHDVPLGIALAVAHHESGLDTCAGSPTGVKGVMQLTKRTGRSMGFDRDINEQNIEGGIKYLGDIVRKCGQYNYACLASRYNGASAGEQRGWAAGVARNHNWFSNYAGSGNIPTITTPRFTARVDYGSSGAQQAAGGAVDSVNRALAGINDSVSRLQVTSQMIDSLSALVGASEVYQDAWDDNTNARVVNGELVNELVKVQAMFNELLAARMQLQTSKMSETSKALAADETVNPYSCDPVILEKVGVPKSLWRSCGDRLAAESSSTTTTVYEDSSNAAATVGAIQEAAEAAE